MDEQRRPLAPLQNKTASAQGAPVANLPDDSCAHSSILSSPAATKMSTMAAKINDEEVSIPFLLTASPLLATPVLLADFIYSCMFGVRRVSTSLQFAQPLLLSCNP